MFHSIAVSDAAPYDGALQMETGVVNTLYLTSNDGPASCLEGLQIIDNDRAYAARAMATTLDLDTCIHDLELLHFQRIGHGALQLEGAGPESRGTHQTIGGDSLILSRGIVFHEIFWQITQMSGCIGNADQISLVSPLCFRSEYPKTG